MLITHAIQKVTASMVRDQYLARRPEAKGVLLRYQSNFLSDAISMNDLNDYGDNIIALEAVLPASRSVSATPRQPLQPVIGQLTAKSPSVQLSPKKLRDEIAAPVYERQQSSSLPPSTPSAAALRSNGARRTSSAGERSPTIASIEFHSEKMAYLMRNDPFKRRPGMYSFSDSARCR